MKLLKTLMPLKGHADIKESKIKQPALALGPHCQDANVREVSIASGDARPASTAVNKISRVRRILQLGCPYKEVTTMKFGISITGLGFIK
jgi:hypothetical protein